MYDLCRVSRLEGLGTVVVRFLYK